MFGQTNPFQMEPESEAADDRRFWTRYPGNMETFCQPMSADTAARPELCWPATVWDVSIGGIGLLIDRRFEPGTPLVLLSTADGLERILTLEVIHVGVHQAGTWLLGCAFSTRLNENELRAVWQDG
jgi:hypothetical protein